MKSTNSNDDNSKTTQSKSNKKSTKSRSKTSKSEASHSSTNRTTTSTNSGNVSSNNNSYVATTPTTPTSSLANVNNIFDTTLAASGSNYNHGLSDMNSNTGGSGSRGHHKNYAGFEPRSIKIIWEQHDQSDVELSQEVCTRLAEDASYKLWELINNIKTYARHSGGVITYDLVNEVLRDADVPPALGAMDTSWDRIDYDGSFFFYSDKILELRDEYQKEITIEMPHGADFTRSWIVEDKQLEPLQKYVPSLVYVTLHGGNDAFESVLQEVSSSPLTGTCYRVLLAKIIQILAYKQTDEISARCWCLLRSCAVNPFVREVDCREEYYHLAEILICQLVGPLECIRLQSNLKDHQKSETAFHPKMENADIKIETMLNPQTNVKSENVCPEQQAQQDAAAQFPNQSSDEKIFHLQMEDDDSGDAVLNLDTSSKESNSPSPQFSPYFASPVDTKFVDDLCSTLGLLSALSGYFQSESLFLVTRRLDRFFDGRHVNTTKEFIYLARAVRGLIALGEYSFREFIPFLYKFEAENIPENIWNDFALAAIYLHGPDDIFLYEWLEFVCGGDKLQPFMVYLAEYHEKLLTTRYLLRKQPTFKINPKPGVRRLEWNTLAAAMCHGDDPSRALKPKPKLNEMFPELVLPNLQLNRPGNIRFKFAGCRPVLHKPKVKNALQNSNDTIPGSDAQSISSRGIEQHDIFIAKRKLYKPLSNERRIVSLSSFFYVRI